jgi:DNA-binding beta-propeller fold protein YncE
VLGAADFDTAGSGVSATGLDYPSGIAIDPTSGAVFVSLEFSHRVLRFSDWNALVNGAAAEAVIGQANFTDSDPGVSATAFNEPSGLHVDSSGRLWVADSPQLPRPHVRQCVGPRERRGGDPRARATGFHHKCGGDHGDAKMINPSGVFVDGGDKVWVADAYNNRVLKFGAVSTLVNGAAAVLVLGSGPTSPMAVPRFDRASAMANPSAVTDRCL